MRLPFFSAIALVAIGDVSAQAGSVPWADDLRRGRLSPPLARARGLPEFECLGPGFDSRWASFQEELHRSLPDSSLDILAMVADGDLPAPPTVLTQLAGKLAAEECERLGFGFLHDFDRFFWTAGKKGAEAEETDEEKEQQHRWWIDVDSVWHTNSSSAAGATAADDSAEHEAWYDNRLCLYGCVAAELIVALALLGAAQAADGREAVRDALDHLRIADGLLGRGGALDLVSSSSWRVGSEVVGGALRRFVGSPTPAQQAEPAPAEQAPPVGLPQSALALARRWQPCDPILHDGCWGRRDDVRTPPAVDERRVRQGAGAGAPLVVTILGEHAPFADDVAQSVVAAGASYGMVLELVYAGQFYLCRGAGSGCAEDEVKAWLRAWLGRWERVRDESPAEEAAALESALRAHPHARALNPDLFLCGDSAVFCWLLRRRAPGRERLAAVPALHMLGMQLLQYVPRPWHTELMLDFRDWWLERREHRDQFAVFMEALGLQLQWQLGIVLPFVPSLGPAARLGIAHDPPSQAEDPSVVVLRSVFLGRPAGRVFEAGLRRFAEANAATHRVKFSWMASFAKLITTGEEPGVWQSFEWMARHSCALFVPTEMSQIKFRDVYAMGLPVLVPDDVWMLRLLREMFKSWGQLSAEYETSRFPVPSALPALRAVEAAVDAWPHGPFYDPVRDGPQRLAFWYELADVKRYPHVVHFSSFPELLDLAASADWAELGRRMRGHSATVAANVGRYYRRSLAALLTS